MRQREGFFAEATTGGLVGQGAGGQDFQRHIALQPLVARPVDHAHPTGADLFHNLVVAQRLADHGSRLLTFILGRVREQVKCA